MRRALEWSWWVWVVLFFVVVESVRADDVGLRQALDQLSRSYTEVQLRLRDREAALQTLTASLAIARTESELFQQLWTESQVRMQTLGANLSESDAAATQRQLVAALRKLYLVEADRQRLTELLKRLIVKMELNEDAAVEVAATKQWLAKKTVRPMPGRSTLGAARVLEVNPKLNLLVLNVGADQGARIGMPMIILRGDRVVAELRVVDVRQNICGALIEKVMNNVTLQAGDTAQVTKG